MCKYMSGYRKRKMKCVLINKKWWQEMRENQFTFTEKTDDSYLQTDSEIGV